MIVINVTITNNDLNYATEGRSLPLFIGGVYNLCMDEKRLFVAEIV